MNVDLTTSDINYLCTLLRTSARDKQRRARQVPDIDRADMEASAQRDHDLRKKLIGTKANRE